MKTKTRPEGFNVYPWRTVIYSILYSGASKLG